jgi:hypothetical protein
VGHTPPNKALQPTPYSLRSRSGFQARLSASVRPQEMNVFTVTGVLVLALSMYPILRFVEIEEKYRTSHALYDFATIRERSHVSFAGHKVVLKDTFSGSEYHEHDRRTGPVAILINGKDYSVDSPIEIRPKFQDENRYFSWLSIFHLTNKNSRKSLLAIIQRIGEPPATDLENLSQLRFRVLYLWEDGGVSEETFSYTEQNIKPYRAALVNDVSPVVVMYFPNLLVPILVPGVSALAGIVLVVIGIVRKKREKTRIADAPRVA